MVRRSKFLSRLQQQAVVSLLCVGVLAGCGGGGGSASSAQGATSAATAATPPNSTIPAAPASGPGSSSTEKVVGLKWQPPSANADGSPLTSLAGYRVLYGRTEDNLDQSVMIADGNVIECAIEALDPGLWYFAVVTQGADGIEGPRSNVVWKIVG